MKRLTLKWKIMLWYTALLILLLGMALPFMYFKLSSYMYSSAEAVLQAEVNRVAESLERENHDITIEGAEIDLVETGTYVAAFSNDNLLISGILPQGFYLEQQPQYGDIYPYGNDGHTWLVCDYKMIEDGESPGWIRAIKSLDSVTTTLQNLRMTILVLIPVYIAVALLGGFLIANKALSPIIQITKTAKQITKDDLSKRIHYNGPQDEVGELAETFDSMLDRLKESFYREKRFSSDVSHELRTPVTAIMVSAESSLNRNETVDEYRDSMEAIWKESKIMSTMISQLLMMARGNDAKNVFEMEPINISDLTHTIIDELLDRSEHPDITLTAEIEDGIILQAEQTLYMRLLINLIDNAQKYNRPGGQVAVSLSQANDFVMLQVKDTGIGISEENLPRIWDRFYKADVSRADSSPGLGLSIVKWIADLHGGMVSVKSEPGSGSLFEVRFPLK